MDTDETILTKTLTCRNLPASTPSMFICYSTVHFSLIYVHVNLEMVEIIIRLPFDTITNVIVFLLHKISNFTLYSTLKREKLTRILERKQGMAQCKFTNIRHTLVHS